MPITVTEGVSKDDGVSIRGGLSVNKGLVDSGVFFPEDLSNHAASWDATKQSNITFGSGSGIGATVGQVANTLSPGTENLKSTRVELATGTNDGHWYYSSRGFPAFTNVDEAAGDLLSDTATLLQTGRTYFYSGKVLLDGETTVVLGGNSSQAQLIRSAANSLVWVRNQATTTETIVSGVTRVTYPILNIAVVLTSLSSITIYANNGTATTSLTFNPDDAVNSKYFRIGAYNAATGTGEFEFYRGDYYTNLKTAAEVEDVFEFYNRTFLPTSSGNILQVSVGQSNNGNVPQGSATRFTHEERWKVYNHAGSFVHYDASVSINDFTNGLYDILDFGTPGYGYQQAFAQLLAKNYPQNVYFCVNAVGGVGWTEPDEWSDRNGSDPFDTTTYYGAMITRVQSAIDELSPSLIIFTLQGGEHDASAAVAATAQEVTDSLGAIIDNIRSDVDFGSGTDYFLIGQPSDNLINVNAGADYPNVSDVQSGIAAVSKTRTAIVDTSGAATSDDIHFTRDGSNTNGGLYYTAFDGLINP